MYGKPSFIVEIKADMPQGGTYHAFLYLRAADAAAVKIRMLDEGLHPSEIKRIKPTTGFTDMRRDLINGRRP